MGLSRGNEGGSSGGGLMKRNMKQGGMSVDNGGGGWMFLKSGETNQNLEIQDKKLEEMRCE